MYHCYAHQSLLVLPQAHPKWKAITMRVKLMRSPRTTSTAVKIHVTHTVTTGYHRNTWVLPRKGSAEDGLKK